MNLKQLFAFIIWYGLLSMLYISLPSNVSSGGSTSYDFVSDVNGSITEDDLGGGGVGDVLSSVAFFFAFILFGYGLPSGTPVWISVFFLFWNTMVTLLFAGWLVNIVWNPG